MDTLKDLLERTSTAKMTSEQREEQRQSFAYGNTKFENDRITRSTVDRASKEIAAESHNKR